MKGWNSSERKCHVDVNKSAMLRPHFLTSLVMAVDVVDCMLGKYSENLLEKMAEF